MVRHLLGCDVVLCKHSLPDQLLPCNELMFEICNSIKREENVIKIDILTSMTLARFVFLHYCLPRQ